MNVAIIAAAGQGRRMAGARPKQFLELAGIPIIVHTLKVFEGCDVIHKAIVVLAADQVAGFSSILEKYGLRKIEAVVAGGETRAQSVFHGLQAVDGVNAEVVAVHDGVRPFVTAHEIAQTVAVAKLQGAAILVSSPVDTLKEIKDGMIVRTVDRSTIRNALTPQCFHYKLLRRAYEGADLSDPDLTDEASLVERLGVNIAVVEGSSRNIKITRPDDLAIGEVLLKNRS
ncbi:MAG TPA: 2-C-methyl-D-erythritol 4-phosphate cytidylyltransferase [Pyrinomonadaceae bacterium]|nr:2-C-methyl-D-erythritol 4-phosphate cytidylyltransferase [Pyrinomonadaceae bacterium]